VDAPDVVVARAETYVTTVGCMATLGQIQKAVVELRLAEGLPGEDVAAMLGLSAANTAVLLHRAKAKLRSCIADEAAGEKKTVAV
jgi:RNA polymerase sigma-70 factor (ECF subfamily)